MDCVDMFLQTVCFRKWFATRFTFVAFMNCVNVSLQRSCFRKWFPTRFTFVIFVAFMNCVDVFLQSACIKKWFATRITFLAFMNQRDKFFQIVIFMIFIMNTLFHLSTFQNFFTLVILVLIYPRFLKAFDPCFLQVWFKFRTFNWFFGFTSLWKFSLLF